MDKTKKEIWKDIKGYKGYYQISNLGRVKGLKRISKFQRVRNGKKSVIERITPQHILVQSMDQRGYLHVRLYKNKSDIKLFKVHRLVAQHFLFNYKSRYTVNHINGIKTDNSVQNLRMCTARQNMKFYRQKFHKNPRYICKNTGQVFTQFKRFCDKHNIQHSVYYFKKSWNNHEQYMNTGFFFEKQD